MCLVGNSCNGRNGRDQCFKMQRRKWNWLGHELRREGVNNCFMVLGWTPEDGRVGGRPKTTWGRTVTEGLQGRVEELECGQDGGM